MDLSFEREIKKYARANANIALVKYWGKRDEALKLPHNSSLSITLDALYTDTGMAFHDGQEDVFYLNGERQGLEETTKISRFLNLFREIEKGRNSSKNKVFVSSYNNFPTAAGLASSASGYAALAAAANQLFQTDLTGKELSVITRKGSGSACRSLFGGFVVWHRGNSDVDSYAESFAAADDYALVVVLVNTKRKKHSSTQGMKQVTDSSIYYRAWAEQAEKDFEAMKQAIYARDFCKMGQIAEANCLKMHATTWGVKQPFTYLEPESLMIMEKIRRMRESGLEAYFTVDAGPNIKIFCRKADLPAIQIEMQKEYPAERLLVSYAGKGHQIKECEHFGQR